MQSSIDSEAQRERPRRGQPHFPTPSSGNGYQHRSNEEREGGFAEYGDRSATYWNLYLSEAKTHDENLVQDLDSDTKSMTLVNTIFSSIIASFIIEMYKKLQPVDGQQTSFKPSYITIRMNIVMFLSLFLSLMSVVMSALLQQWCREFMKYAHAPAPPHKRGRVRTYLSRGLDQSQMRRFMYGIQELLHISIFLFFWAVSDFLYTVYQPVGTVARYSLLTSLVVYLAFSISPLILINSPYHTPLTPPLRSVVRLILLTIRALSEFLPSFEKPSFSFLKHFRVIRFDRAHFLVDKANERAKTLDGYAMEWLFTEDDLSDEGMDKFIEALPGYIYSPHTPQECLAEMLTTSYIIERIKTHFLTCATSYWLSDEACIARVSACVTSLRVIFKTSDNSRLHGHGDDKKGYVQGIIGALDQLCGGTTPVRPISPIHDNSPPRTATERIDRRVALRASCVKSLAFQGLLTHLTPPDVERIPNQPFPDHLGPLFLFVRDWDNSENSGRAGPSQPLDNRPISTEGPNHPSSNEDSSSMWKVLLHDGPLVNLSCLADAVISHEETQTLSLCWKALETLLKELSIARMKASESALRRFDKVLKKVHEHIRVDHRGFRVKQLLETLDTVARGRRLSMVFLGHPEYYGKAEVVFGKEQLRNRDLMEAFASCLPGYIANTPEEERREFMEGMVCDDGLWTSLQVNLWNAVRLEIPITDKLRIFEACCAVINAMFFSLEDSDKVDWRTPDFGSLAQHFEMFVTSCFQGTFVGRASGYRVGLIKLRFCKAVLTQFHKELRRDHALSLRSQWDVAALARVFYTLEVGNVEDVEFWKTFTDGGHIGPEFMTRVREMLNIAIRDGPLLNFCKLGHLAATAVPFAGSGLGDSDIAEVQELQAMLVEDQDLPLNRAAAEVWDDLNRLRLEVCDVLTKSSDQEKALLERLLGMIERADDLRPSFLPELHPSPSEQSAHTPSHDDVTGPQDLPSPQPAVHDRITSRVVNQIDIVPLPPSPVHPRLSYTRQPSRRSTMPTSLPTARQSLGPTADARSRPPTLSDTSPPSTLFSDPDPLLSDIPKDPLQGSSDSSDYGQPISPVAFARDGNTWII